MNKEESLKDVFVVIKGQYRKDPHNKSDDIDICGYDPEDPNTKEWYQAMDKECCYTVCCSSDLDVVLRGLENVMKRYQTKKNYYKHLYDTTTEDYYRTHYLHKDPLTPHQRENRALGRCPRVPVKMKELYHKVIQCYGDYYSIEVSHAEKSALKYLADNTPSKRMKRKVLHLKHVDTLPVENSTKTTTKTTRPKKSSAEKNTVSVSCGKMRIVKKVKKPIMR